MKIQTADAFAFDSQFYKENIKFIAGADEVGRGPLAGPVVVASVIMNRQKMIDGVGDSKKISEKKREMLFDLLKSEAISCGIGWVDREEIDAVNILNATRKAFKESLEALEQKPDFVLMDYITGVETNVPYEAIKHGDATSYVIGCASIIAKVTRDRYMIEMDNKYPQYNFAKNKGYGTKEHIDAIKKYGPCPLHRMTFISKFLGDYNE